MALFPRIGVVAVMVLFGMVMRELFLLPPAPVTLPTLSPTGEVKPLRKKTPDFART
jgi:hypothetical protein